MSTFEVGQKNDNERDYVRFSLSKVLFSTEEEALSKVIPHKIERLVARA